MPEKTKPEDHEARLGSPFCADPMCPYCKELRELHEEISKKNERGRDTA